MDYVAWCEATKSGDSASQHQQVQNGIAVVIRDLTEELRLLGIEPEKDADIREARQRQRLLRSPEDTRAVLREVHDLMIDYVVPLRWFNAFTDELDVK